MKKSAPPKIDQQTIIEAISFVDKFPDKDMCRQVEGILMTHLPMYDNALDAVSSIIREYTISADIRMIFIGIAGKMII